ncbi:NUDIX domain-containing protein [Candidatus Woesearchaeota archaeon]|nr:NUDIX domain-containing protein [Candidatus Woesearchaeota archaeon]
MVYNRAAVIIIDKDKVLLLHRIKKGKDYYVIPGGTIEEDEKPEEAAVREIKEETNFDIELGEVFCRVNDFMHNGIYFLAKKFSGELRLGGPELQRVNDNNQYHLEWVHKKDLQKLLLYPKEVKEKIMDYFSS